MKTLSIFEVLECLRPTVPYGMTLLKQLLWLERKGVGLSFMMNFAFTISELAEAETNRLEQLDKKRNKPKNTILWDKLSTP